MLRSLLTLVTVAVITLVSFAATAHATSLADPAGDGSGLYELARPVIDAILHGQPWLAASLALVFVVALIGKYGDKLPGRLGRAMAWLDSSDPGRAILVLVGSFGGALAATLAGGAPMTLAIAWTALKVAIGGAGIYSLAKKLLTPLVSKAPAWLQPVLRLILWAFERKERAAADAATKAQTAGDEAVKANPPTGAAGIVGSPRDVK